jgi:hypothetical protein
MSEAEAEKAIAQLDVDGSREVRGGTYLIIISPSYNPPHNPPHNKRR